MSALGLPLLGQGIGLRTPHYREVLARLSLAAALGGVIGVEREFREREAGLRTHMLVSVGSE